MHRTLSQWLDTDHHAQRKPWSWVADASDLVIGLLDDRLADRLVPAADAAGIPVRRVATASWSELRNGTGLRTGTAPPNGSEPRNGRAWDGWCLRFVSPVTFRRGNLFLPWPSPSTVFGSLRSTWRSFGAPAVGDLELDLHLDPLVVTAISGASRTERVTVHKHESVLVGGFVGTVRYALEGAVDRHAVDALVRLAPFSGVGAYTTRGFGGVRAVGD